MKRWNIIKKRALALSIAAFTTFGAVIPSNTAYATETDSAVSEMSSEDEVAVSEDTESADETDSSDESSDVSLSGSEAENSESSSDDDVSLTEDETYEVVSDSATSDSAENGGSEDATVLDSSDVESDESDSADSQEVIDIDEEVDSEVLAQDTDSLSVNTSTEKEDAIRSGVILHAFCWSFETLTENMENIADAGYTTIQTSPINECLSIYNGLYWNGGDSTNGMWYYHYQPTDWTIGNYQLGTRDEFKTMCATAEEYGINVIVDILPNHTTPMYSQVSENLINAVGGDIENLYHDESNDGLAITDYSDRIQCTRYMMGGLPDVDTENEGFQEYFFKYLWDCIECGADGFRIDTAKHIALSDDPAPDGVENTFYTNMNTEVFDQADLFVYGEVLQGSNERLGAYQEAIGGTTASNYGASIRSALTSNNYSVSNISDYCIDDDASASKLVTWVESHDNYLNDGTYTLTDEQIKLGWGIITARAEGTPLFFSRPMNSGTTADTMYGDNIIGEAGSDIYRDDEVVAVNKFRTAMAGEEENLVNPDGDTSVLMIERGTKGLVVVNGNYDNTVLDTTTNLADGTYINKTDDGSVFTVVDGEISGILPARSLVVLYEAEDSEYTTVFYYGSVDTVSLSESDAELTVNEYKDNWQTIVVPASIKDGFTLTINGTDYTLDQTTGRYICSTGIFSSISDAEQDMGITENSAYYLNTNMWDEVYAYAWYNVDEDGETTTYEPFGKWPGTKIYAESGHWYKAYTKDTESRDFNIIFHNNDGTQTDNLAVTSSANYFVGNDTTAYASKDEVAEATGYSDDYTYVYFLNNKGWDQVGVYVYGIGEAFGAWPGELAEKVDGVSGDWYRAKVPAGPGEGAYIIFNNYISDTADNASEKAQTGNIPVNCFDNYVSANSITVYSSMEEVEDVVSGKTQKTEVYFYNDAEWDQPYVYAWNTTSNDSITSAWPGITMTKVTGSWYKASIPCGAAEDVELIFNNNNGTQLSCTMDSKLNVYYDSEGQITDTTTVYFYNKDNWSDVYAYTWGACGELFGGWPGTATVEIGDGWYAKTLPAAAADDLMIIFNNAGSGSQTKDLCINDSEKVYVSCADNTTYASKNELLEALGIETDDDTDDDSGNSGSDSSTEDASNTDNSGSDSSTEDASNTDSSADNGASTDTNVEDKTNTQVETEETVVEATKIKLNKKSVKIGQKGTYQLVATVTPSNATDATVTWKSSNSKVAKVDSNGLVTAKKKGTATITATTSNGLTATCKIKVTKQVKVTSVKLNKKSKTLKVGKTYTLKAKVKPTDATIKDVTWKSSNKKVATVSSDGTVTAVKKGTATITVKTKDGKYKATCKIKVK